MHTMKLDHWWWSVFRAASGERPYCMGSGSGSRIPGYTYKSVLLKKAREFLHRPIRIRPPDETGKEGTTCKISEQGGYFCQAEGS